MFELVSIRESVVIDMVRESVPRTAKNLSLRHSVLRPEGPL